MQNGHVVEGKNRMTRFDIDSLSEAELVELNHKILARLRFLNQMRSHSAILEFRIGERVTFRPVGRSAVIGIITHYNKKTVTVVTNSGDRWNVTPNLLSRLESASTASERGQDLRVVPPPHRGETGETRSKSQVRQWRRLQPVSPSRHRYPAE